MNESGMRGEDEMPDHYWDGWVAFSMGGHPLRMREYPPKKKPENFYAGWNKKVWAIVLENLLTSDSWAWMRIQNDDWLVLEAGEEAFGSLQFLHALEAAYENHPVATGETRDVLLDGLRDVFNKHDVCSTLEIYMFSDVPALVSDLADVFMEAVQDA